MNSLDERPNDVVIIIDDDASICESLGQLVRSVGLRAAAYQSIHDFLQSKLPDAPSCLVVDVRMPEASGLDLQSTLTKAGALIPVVFMTAHGDVPMTVRAMKGGAIDFLIKPYREQDILDAIQAGLAVDRKRRETEADLSVLKARYATLTLREKEIMSLVTEGLMNKQIAGVLGLSEITVKVHRSAVIRKMSAGSLAELVSIARDLNIGSLSK